MKRRGIDEIVISFDKCYNREGTGPVRLVQRVFKRIYTITNKGSAFGLRRMSE